MLRIPLLIMFCVILAGCVTQGQLGTLPKVDDLTTACDVYIIRESSIHGAALSYPVAIDHQDFLAMTKGHYTHIKVACGSHVITVKYPTFLFLSTNEKSIEFECKSSKIIYVSFCMAPGGEWAVLSDEEGAKLVKESEYIDVKQ
jgi:hypothetical protein